MMAKVRKYIVNLTIPKTHFHMLQRLAQRLGTPVEQLVEQTLQEYLVRYVLPVVQHIKH